MLFTDTIPYVWRHLSFPSEEPPRRTVDTIRVAKAHEQGAEHNIRIEWPYANGNSLCDGGWVPFLRFLALHPIRETYSVWSIINATKLIIGKVLMYFGQNIPATSRMSQHTNDSHSFWFNFMVNTSTTKRISLATALPQSVGMATVVCAWMLRHHYYNGVCE